jgi:Tfp pilus assembly protein PilN
MRRVSLNVIGTRRYIPWLGWALLAAALAGAGQVAWALRSLQAEIERIETRVERLRARTGVGVPQDPKLMKQRAEEVHRARLVTQQLTLPWGVLFEAVEQSATGRVALLSLRPETSQNLVRITAETRDFADAVEFVRRLEATRRLRSVHLASHQVQEQDPQRPIRFVVVGTLVAEEAS